MSCWTSVQMNKNMKGEIIYYWSVYVELKEQVFGTTIWTSAKLPCKAVGILRFPAVQKMWIAALVLRGSNDFQKAWQIGFLWCQNFSTSQVVTFYCLGPFHFILYYSILFIKEIGLFTGLLLSVITEQSGFISKRRIFVITAKLIASSTGSNEEFKL